MGCITSRNTILLADPVLVDRIAGEVLGGR
jgi:hypothetical protein